MRRQADAIPFYQKRQCKNDGYEQETDIKRSRAKQKQVGARKYGDLSGKILLAKMTMMHSTRTFDRKGLMLVNATLSLH